MQRIKKEFEKHLYEKAKGDMISMNHKLEFSSNTVYKVVSLKFGGFLAFDVDQVSYCSRDLKTKPSFSRKLRSSLAVTGFCEVDEYDYETKRTKQGSKFMRYLFATESGELFMLAF